METTPASGRSDGAVLISVRDVRKDYATQSGTSIRAIDRITFDLRRGEFVSIVGPSGCGKSTLLKMLAGLVEPSEGRISHVDRAAQGVRESAMVFQDAILFPWRTVLQNVELPMQVMRADRRDYRPRALDLLKSVGLEGFDQKYPNELSGGMQQRVAIARALVQDPKLLLMDEPFGSLDAMTREQMTLELQQLWEQTGKTVVFVTHSITESVFLSDRVIVMSGRPSTIAGVLDIDLARPRDFSMLGSPAFGTYSRRIRTLLAADERVS